MAHDMTLGRLSQLDISNESRRAPDPRKVFGDEKFTLICTKIWVSFGFKVDHNWRVPLIKEFKISNKEFYFFRTKTVFLLSVLRHPKTILVIYYAVNFKWKLFH